MIKEEDFDAAADGPEDMAFVRLERKYREVLEKNLSETDSGNSYEAYIIEYINHTIATAKALGLTFLDEWRIPDGSGRIWDTYKDFTTDVDHFTIQIQISHIRSGPRNCDESRNFQ